MIDKQVFFDYNKCRETALTVSQFEFGNQQRLTALYWYYRAVISL